MLGQEAVSGKSNEITAIPLLLERLALKGALITPDAIGAPGSVAETILARGGDHRLALKANRPAAAKDGEAFFTDPSSDSVETGETTDGDHGRIETRREGKLTRERRPHRSSARLDAATFAQAVRGPWGIGNRLHGMLDVVFKDGLSRRRSATGPRTWPWSGPWPPTCCIGPSPPPPARTAASARGGTPAIPSASSGRARQHAFIRLPWVATLAGLTPRGWADRSSRLSLVLVVTLADQTQRRV